jgi:hypothetical protein
MKQTNSDLKKYQTIGVCGLDCGLCPRYYTAGISRCPGCGGPDFSNKHPSCSFITCCVRKKNLEVCAECSDFPCSKFKSDEEYQKLKGSSSYPSYKNVLSNLNFIKENGIEPFAEQQKRRIESLEIMIKNFDDGRSRSFYCRAAGFLDIKDLEDSIEKANKKIRSDNINPKDTKTTAGILKDIIKKVAIMNGSRLS